MSVLETRKAEAGVNDLFIDRWSPRAYAADEIPDSDLFTVLEAARWAPSARNAQPWRFVYARRGAAGFQGMVASMAAYNQQWAPKASALIALLSAKVYPFGDKTEPNGYHSFDAGAAWVNLSLQANLLGWRTRAIGAFDKARAAEALKVPETYAVEVIIAIGKPGDPEMLPADLRSKESPTTRLPLRELISDGVFKF
ncbi:nitroreductase family protein [Telmatospirillum siberiense]|uniref:Nitroreductase domain-containing protein n=1 Tax=Telmatospirillum siberiense TaxID=382514 RepID=A0A2N3PPN8_9PROT|nr:nitroreductase family protein [Telmatospirillum siberiense]PKU22348.1 hypothetical protein CWS72_21975 [Telmatospirillum siberiense]